ncbi:hypothetical protein DESA109040_11500 [Deinococcus saxicola]|uniref:hypothetical protein n=1 Tax=Deinococcus saxicola TaxID=249406 RepID=UPI0039F43A03
MQATLAGVRRWETEKMLGNLRADHSRTEVADAVAAAAAQAEWLRLNVRELQTELTGGQNVMAQLAHARPTLTQLDAFLQAFTPQIDAGDADLPLLPCEARLDHDFFSLEVPLDPEVLRARHALKLAQWQAETEPGTGSATAQARFVPLRQQVGALEERLRVLGQRGGDPLSLARVQLEWRLKRVSARVQAQPAGTGHAPAGIPGGRG